MGIFVMKLVLVALAGLALALVLDKASDRIKSGGLILKGLSFPIGAATLAVVLNVARHPPP